MKNNKKSISKCLGEFVGHIWVALKSKTPSDNETSKEGTIVFRKTTIEEIEVNKILPSKKTQGFSK